MRKSLITARGAARAKYAHRRVKIRQQGGDDGRGLAATAAAIGLALPGFEAALGLIDDVNAALAANDTIVAVTAAQRFQ
jgi:hypothetical protein